MTSTKKRFTTDDFITGILAALVLRGVRTISREGTRLDVAFARVFSENLREQAELHNLDIPFRIRPNPARGHSPAVQAAIASAVLRCLITFIGSGGSDIRIKISESWAQKILLDLPGSPEMYKGFAAKFVEGYYETRFPDPTMTRF